MGSRRRAQPKRLKSKLKAIREQRRMTQQEMAGALKKHAPDEYLDSSHISKLEQGKREPSLPAFGLFEVG